jgi:hypothetical protein
MRFSRKGFFGRIPRIVLSTITKFMKRKKNYYNEEKNVDELKKKHQEGPAATPAPPGFVLIY